MGNVVRLTPIIVSGSYLIKQEKRSRIKEFFWGANNIKNVEVHKIFKSTQVLIHKSQPFEL